MQTVIQVITGVRGSLRERIMNDPQLKRFDLIPTEHQRPGRPHGWAKIHSETAHGAINLEWHGRTGVLTCRVVKMKCDYSLHKAQLKHAKSSSRRTAFRPQGFS